MPMPPPPAVLLSITGIAEPPRLTPGLVEAREQLGAGQERHAQLARPLARDVLEAEVAHLRRRRSDERQARRLARLGERGVLAEEAVARVHRLGAGRARGGEDLVDVEVALRRWRRPEAHRLVRHRHVRRVAVGVGVDGDAAHTHAAQCAQDAAGDDAAVGDQDFAEHLDGGLRGGA